jgi:hypothetical protein
MQTTGKRRGCTTFTAVGCRVTAKANNLGNLLRAGFCVGQWLPRSKPYATRSKEAKNMFGMSPTVLIILALLATAALFLLTPLGRRKPKRPEKWEKAEIMRKLLALSEQEAGRKPAVPPTRTRPPVSRPTPTRAPMRPANIPIKASTKTTLPARSKVR